MTQIKKFQLGGLGQDSTLIAGTLLVLTLNNFITQKLDSIRNSALERSRKKTQEETTRFNEVDVYGRQYLINLLQADYNWAIEEYSRMLNKKYELYKKANPITSNVYSVKHMDDDTELNLMYELVDYTKRRLDEAKKGTYNGTELRNCIANLSEMFPHGLPYGNDTFKANPKKYGFSVIDARDAKPGDLVQAVEDGIPYHAMIYNGMNEKGKHTFNYSNGETPFIDDGILYGGYGTNKSFPGVVSNDGKHLLNAAVYRYTGTPQDSAQWINEYISQYGPVSLHKNGGHLKSTGGTKEDLIRLSTNGYQEDYINNNEFDPNKVKNTMIHVAYNAPSLNTHTYYAKHGGTLNRINYFDYFN